MAIDPLKTYPSLPPSPGSSPGKKGPAAGGFDRLLDSLTGGPASVGSGQAAAELFRIEMMLSSLSLAGEEPPPSRGAQALDSFLAALAGAPPGGPRPAPQACGAAPPGPSAGQPAAGREADGIERTAEQFLGTPYRFGGEGGDGIDCSSFVQQVFHEHGIELPRTAREQIKVGTEVADGDLKKGDLVFFQTYASYPSHVGIYLGEGKMIHASSGRGEVTVSDMNSDYYRSRYLGAKRLA